LDFFNSSDERNKSMGASKTYKGSPGWAKNHSNRGKESKYTSHPVAKMEGTHMSGETKLRQGSKGGGNKSRTISGPARGKGSNGYS
jgi:hypothetical protein